jgi:uncharacterized protein (AIM24 family)
VNSDWLACANCGAPVGRAQHTTQSGWMELPPIADMTRLRVGNSTCQIEGACGPVADFNLATGDYVYFTHHVLLWRDPSVKLEQMRLAGGLTRLFAGLPIMMTEAHGPGHVAFSSDHAGEIVALPLAAEQKIDVREHLFLVATSNLSYRVFDPGIWYQTERSFHYPLGQYMDRFSAAQMPGLLLLHAPGNVFVRTLQAGETLLVRAAALIFKDPSVQMSLRIEYPAAYRFGGHRLTWIHLSGPGRVGVKSACHHHDDGMEAIVNQSPVPFVRQSMIARSLRGPTSPITLTPTTDRPLQVDPRHELITRMAIDALVDGVLDAHELANLIKVAKEQGMSEYDVRLIVNHAKSHPAKSGA